MTKRNLEQVQEEIKQLDRQLENLDKRQRELADLELELEGLQKASVQPWINLAATPLSGENEGKRSDFFNQVNQTGKLLVEELDDRWASLKKERRQAEDRFDQLLVERNRLYQEEDDKNKENTNGN